MFDPSSGFACSGRRFSFDDRLKLSGDAWGASALSIAEGEIELLRVAPF
jgi:hypothetical protein